MQILSKVGFILFLFYAQQQQHNALRLYLLPQSNYLMKLWSLPYHVGVGTCVTHLTNATK